MRTFGRRSGWARSSRGAGAPYNCEVLSARVIVVPAVFLVAGVILDDGALRASHTTIQRRFTPADRLSGRYQYVPFDVPPGTGKLSIAYRFDRANGDNVIDLGL